uniref:ATPase subunit 8 n=1 Tax=Acrochordus granulatus TaxID=46287 RepID=Q402M7_ACRGR|nr:ATP synthase F0 subunit 8 [Acrochordus granulatus]BAE20018.1 ATPase subunit 8 [Acrochordus granulatus]
MPQLDTIHTLTNFIITWVLTVLVSKKIQKITMNSMLKKLHHNIMKLKPIWYMPWT